MRLSTVPTILACLAAAGCSTLSTIGNDIGSTTSDTLSADVWLCAYQIGDRYRDDATKPTVTAYDTVTSAPIRRTTITYMVPNEGLPPVKHTLTCDSAPYGYGIVAEDGFKLAVTTPAVYPGNTVIDPTVQGRVADQVRDAVQATGLHVQIAGIAPF
jgi:predicted small secreted protein